MFLAFPPLVRTPNGNARANLRTNGRMDIGQTRVSLSLVAPRTRSLLLLVSYWECSPAVAHGTHRNSRRSRETAARECEFRTLWRSALTRCRLHDSPNLAKRNDDTRWNVVWIVPYKKESERERENVFSFIYLFVITRNCLASLHLSHHLIYNRVANKI